MGGHQILRVLVVDDEPLARERLHSLLQQAPGVLVSGAAGNGDEAMEMARRSPPDLVLLDIAMPGRDGLEIARQLAELRPRPGIVFVTAHAEHAAAAFDVEALDYLVKPVRRERLDVALQRARQFLATRGSFAADGSRAHLLVRQRGGVRRIAIDEVIYLQADDKYVMVHHARGGDLIEESLKSLEETFPGRFLRIHRNCLVARRALEGLRRDGDGQYHALLHGVAEPLEISRRCLPEVRQAIEQE
ncbi:LytR/AlgR family response regulator transcription factor [Solilutibacter silvestris]|uniref:LytR/AlgR-type response regulator n=1 Tax=Solilutibacter silvestris TaxID=1645665 RepID=A0A2K1Q076_9GAMM|nr:LytTR family DNA-binding domain-containing protein [Lysobacter silvestris]PNS08433.1 LytR/AlgR-type response regulator [Lysobacter silvestris]